jgi:hypothetical protein
VDDGQRQLILQLQDIIKITLVGLSPELMIAATYGLHFGAERMVVLTLPSYTLAGIGLGDLSWIGTESPPKRELIA